MPVKFFILSIRRDTDDFRNSRNFVVCRFELRGLHCTYFEKCCFNNTLEWALGHRVIANMHTFRGHTSTCMHTCHTHVFVKLPLGGTVPFSSSAFIAGVVRTM